MNKKLMIGIILVFLVVILVILIKKNNSTVMETDVRKSVIPNNGEQVTFTDDAGNPYTAIYNADSFIYEIFNKNGEIVAITPNKFGVEEYVKNPYLMFASEETQ